MQLVINTFGASLRKQGDRFVVRAGDKQVAVSAHKVQSILVATGVLLSSDAIQLASSHDIDIVFLDGVGPMAGCGTAAARRPSAAASWKSPNNRRRSLRRRPGVRPGAGGG